MKTNPQLGQHPDADRLNAFVERALTEPEREQTLTHLATCEDCREIVYLVAGDDAAALMPVANVAPQSLGTELAGGVAQRPWFARPWFAVAGPALALLVTAAGIGVVQRGAQNTKQAVALEDTRMRQQMAQEPSKYPIETPQPAAQQSIQQETARKPEQKTDKRPEPMATGLASPAAARVLAPVQQGHVLPAPVGAPVGRQNFLEKKPSNIPMAPRAAASVVSTGIGSYQANAVAIDSLSSDEQSVSPAPGQGRVMATSNATGTAQLQPSAGYARARTAAVAPPPPPTGVNQSQVAKSEDTVTGNTPVLETNSILEGPVSVQSLSTVSSKKKIENKLVKLPNHQTATSAAFLEKLAIAVDANGNVFRSTNGGSRWQPVASQWTGRATSVRLQQASAKDQHNDFRVLAGVAHPVSTGFQISTDDGKVWTSADGTKWIRQ